MSVNDDFQLVCNYRNFLAMGLDDRHAKLGAIGRERMSVERFDESLRRVEDQLLGLPAVEKFRQGCVDLGMSESAARADALERGYVLVESANRSGAASPASGAVALSEAGPAGLTPDEEKHFRERLGFDDAQIAEAHRRQRRSNAAKRSMTVMLTEPMPGTGRIPRPRR